MRHPTVNFQVCIKDSADLVEMGSRVGSALSCSFRPSDARMFEYEDALETEVLGLWLTLTNDPEPATDENHLYTLVGDLSEDLDDSLWGDELIVISQYILGVLVRRDNPNWYVPDAEEILQAAGISDE